MMKRITQIFNLLLISAAVYFMVSSLYLFVGSRLVRSDHNITAYKPPPREKAEQPPLKSAYQGIIERDLFHTAKKTPEKDPVPIDLDALKPTDLKLKLWGTVSTEDEISEDARAVIEDTQSREQSLYKVGDTVQGAEIIEIFRSSVVLDVNGRKEKLSIAEERIAMEEGGIAAEPDAPDEVMALSRAQIDDALNNVNELMSQAKVKPLFQNGKPDGLIVSQIKPKSIFSEMGFKAGDIITGINGQKIESVDDAMAFYKTLTAGSRLSIQLKRRGRPTVIDFNIE